MKKTKLLLVTASLLLLFIFIACKNDIPQPTGYDTPTILGKVVLPNNITSSSFYVKLGESGKVIKTENDGSFVISGLEEKEYTLYITDYDPTNLVIPRSLDSNSFGLKLPNTIALKESGNNLGTLTLLPTVNISGEVSLSDNKEPFGVDVKIPGTAFIAKSDNTGKYRIENVPQGDYEIKYEKEGYLPISKTFSAYEISENNEVKLNPVKLVDSSGTLSGRAFVFKENDGEELYVKITEKSGGSYYQTATDLESGIFLFTDVVPGEYELTLFKDNYQSFVYENTIKIASSKDVVLSEPIFMTNNVISGNVILEGRDSYEGVTIKFKDSNGIYNEYITDNSGAFSVNLKPGTYTVSFDCADYLPIEQSVVLELNSTKNIPTVELYQRYGSASGNAGMGDVQITASQGNSISSIVVSNYNGSYLFSQLEEGVYNFSFSKPGYISKEINSINIKSGKNTVLEDIILQLAKGTVVGDVGLSGVVITMTDEDGNHVEIESGFDGRYLFENVQPGIYAFKFEKNGFKTHTIENVRIAAGESKELSKVSLVVLPGSINGNVEIGGVNITLQSDSEEEYIDETSSNDDGSYSFIDVEHGSYIIKFAKDGYKTVTKEINVLAGNNTTVPTIKLEAIYGSISGTTDLSGVIVKLLDSSGKTAIDVTESAIDGTFSFSKILSGSYILEFSKPRYVTQQKAITVTGDIMSTISVQMEEKKGIITGNVILKGLADSSGIEVSAISTNNSSVIYKASTDSKGSYLINVPEGSYTITAEKEEFIKVVYSERIDIKEGDSFLVDEIVLIKENVTLTGSVILDKAFSNENISIELKSKDESTVDTCYTDAAGTFTFYDVKPGEYYIEASKEGYTSQKSALFDVLPGIGKTISSLKLPVAIPSIKGKLTLEGKTDYSDILVSAVNISNTSKSYQAKTDSEGNYLIAGMEDGVYNFTFSKDGFSSVKKENISIESSSTLTLDGIELLIARGSISGYVRLQGRNSDLDGTKVLLNGTEFSTTTDKNGYFELTAFVGYYDKGISFSHEDYASLTYDKPIQVKDKTKQDIGSRTLNAVSVPLLVGQVTMKDGSSPDGIVVEIANSSFMTETDNDGRFYFEHVPIGNQTITFSNSDKSYVSKNFNITATTSDLGVITLEENVATIKGISKLSFDDDYGTIDDFSDINVVAVSEDGKVTRSTVTSVDGSFEIKGIYPGLNYNVTFSKDGYTDKVVPVKSILAGQVKIISSSPIMLEDKEKPLVTSVTINDGEDTTDKLTGKIHINGADSGSSIVKMRVSASRENILTTTLLDYKPMLDWNFEEENGLQSVYVVLYDKAGNASDIHNVSITLVNQRMAISGILPERKLHWTVEKAPYYVVGDIFVQNGSILEIDPGVEIVFDGNYSITVDTSSSISANGTYSEPIKVSTNEGVDSWGGIILENSYLSYDSQNGKPVYNRGNKLSNVQISKCTKGISGTAFIENTTIESNDVALASFSGVLNDCEIPIGSVDIVEDTIAYNSSFGSNKSLSIKNSIISESSFDSYANLNNCNIFNCTGTISVTGSESMVKGGTFTGSKTELSGDIDNLTYDNISGEVTISGTVKNSQITTSILNSTGTISDSTINASRSNISGNLSKVNAEFDILEMSNLGIEGSEITVSTTANLDTVNIDNSSFSVSDTLTMDNVTQQDCLFNLSNTLVMNNVNQKNCKFTVAGDVLIDSGDTHNVTILSPNNSITLKNLTSEIFSNNVLEMNKLIIDDSFKRRSNIYSNFLGNYTVDIITDTYINGVYWGDHTSEIINLVNNEKPSFVNSQEQNDTLYLDGYNVNTYITAGYLGSDYFEVEISGDFETKLDYDTSKYILDITNFNATATNGVVLKEFRVSFDKSFPDDDSGWINISSTNHIELPYESFSDLHMSLQVRDSYGKMSRIYEIIPLLNRDKVVEFGTYNSKPISWIVLDRTEDKALLLCKDILCGKPYNEEYTSITWENCTLRKWLNNDFFNKSFTEEEKSKIQLSHIANPDNPEYGTDGGNDTDDYVFLLSIDEAEKYFDSDEDRDCEANWYLRSPGKNQDVAAYVISDGSLGENGYLVIIDYGIRPALWINL